MIQEKDFLYRVPVKNALVTTPGQQTRNPEILVDLEGGEFMHGNILDANSTNKLINQSVKDAVDNKLIESGYVTNDLLDAETSARTKGDEDLGAKIKAEQTRAEGKEKEISDKLAIVDGDSNTEGSFRKAIADVIAAAPEDLDTLKEIADKLADNDDLHTALNQAITDKADASALLNEVTRATSAESALQAAIDTKADATALSNYVLTAALNKQIDTLNTAISAKQDAGSYIPYDQTVTPAYKIDKDLVIDNSIGRAMLGTYSISVTSNSNTEIQINPTGISLNNDGDIIQLSRIGITLPNGDFDHVLTSNGGTINMANYLKESDVSGQFAAKADRSDLATLEQKVAANTTAIEGKQDKGNYMEYSSENDEGYTVHWELATSKPITVENGNGLQTQATYSGVTVSDTDTESSSQLTTSSLTITKGNAVRTEYTVNGISSSRFNNCLATSDGGFKRISDFVLKTELPTVPTKTSELTNDSNFITASHVSDFYFGLTKDLKIYSETIDGIMTISHSDIRLETDSRDFTINNNGFFVSNDADGEYICQFTRSGITFAGKTDDDIPTANGGFIDISNYVLKSVYDQKIAALEARIAALEAKHPETAG